MIEMHEWALLVQWFVWSSGIAALAWLAWRNQMRAEALASALIDSHAWVDEIIEALESNDQEGGDHRIDRLVLDRPLADGVRDGDGGVH
ncbi:membrane protein [Streptomyces phage Stella]|nr:membrane protein [Streptomyces phage Stella]